MMRNIFADLDDLPDKPRLGVNLIFAGLAIITFRYSWRRFALASFERASAVVYRHSPARHPSQDDLGVFLVIAASMCIVSGSFIFFRRGVWWWAERRKERDLIRLKFK